MNETDMNGGCGGYDTFLQDEHCLVWRNFNTYGSVTVIFLYVKFSNAISFILGCIVNGLNLLMLNQLYST